MLKKIIGYGLASLFVTLPIFVYVAGKLDAWPNYFFVVEIQTEQSGVAQLFWDSGVGYNEEESGTLPLQKQKGFQTYKFPIPKGALKGLRFDPNVREGAYLIRNAHIADQQGILFRSFPAKSFIAANQISELEVQGKELFVRTDKGANDPILMIQSEYPLKLEPNYSKLIWLYVCTLVVALGLILALNRIKTKLYQLTSSLICFLKNFTIDHPIKSIVIVAIVATIASSYPVALCGRSYVSANNGPTYMLYNHIPFLPGHNDRVTEDVRVSDVGAMMWQWLPYTILQSHSVLDQIEIPLWNRFNAGGVSLIGQGQSMIGDPLHWIPILFRGAAWAWDLKFILAKTLFSLGCGVIVFAATRSLQAALIISFATPFIGFFAWRLNHGAFFSLCYAPWILVAWLKLVVAKDNKTISFALLLQAVASWMVLNSGTAKEAFILLVFLNLTGLICFLTCRGPLTRRKIPTIVLLLMQCLGLVLITAPYWLNFMNTLAYSQNMYSTPSILTLPLGFSLGFFDNLFYQWFQNGNVGTPSVNFLILVGLLWGIVNIRGLLSESSFVVTLVMAVVSFSLVFGLAPAALLIRIPFIRNIDHIHNTFSCVLIVQVVLLSGYGFAMLGSENQNDDFRKRYILYVYSLLAIATMFFILPGLCHTDLLYRYKYWMWAFLITFVACMTPLLIRKVVFARGSSVEFVVLLVFCFFLLLIRHGMHVETGFGSWDSWVVNPRLRPDFSVKSPAVSFIRAHQSEPFRAFGVDDNLFPGYNAAVGIESLNGPDALFNPYFRELMDAMGFDYPWPWRLTVPSEKLKSLEPALESINVRYVLSSSNKDLKTQDIDLLKSLDLDVWELKKSWPRAFFSPKIVVYSDVGKLAKMVYSFPGKPFAAVLSDDASKMPKIQTNEAPTSNSQISEASDYILTANSTEFVVDTTGPGVVTLLETYVPEEFKVTLNGKPTNYFRVNYAFKGVYIPGQGRYKINFTYEPKYWRLSLWLAGVGIFCLLFLHIRLIYGPEIKFRKLILQARIPV